MNCPNCGTNHEANFCPHCGTAAHQPPPASGVRCPRCGSTGLHPIVESNYETTGKTKGFGLGKGCLGFVLFGWVGWLCGLCGMGKGKTTTTTTSTTYWMCNQCGNKFKA